MHSKKVPNKKRQLCLISNEDTGHVTWFEVVATIVLLGCLVAYLFVGALTLSLTEATVNERHNDLLKQLFVFRNGSELDLIRKQAIENIWDITVSLNILYRNNWTRLAAIELRKFENRYIEKLSEFYHTMPQISENLMQWTLPQSFLYCLLLLTTTGMPNVHISLIGKTITTLFALFGIPLIVIFLSMIGSLAAKLGRLLLKKIICCSNRNNVQKATDATKHVIDSKLFCVNDMLGLDQQRQLSAMKNAKKDLDTWKYNYLVIVAIFVTVFMGYISVGCLVFQKLSREFWTLFETFYFSFLTLTTISFGSEDARLKIFQMGYESNFVFWFISAYILCGLSLLSTFFHIIYDEFLKFV